MIWPVFLAATAFLSARTEPHPLIQPTCTHTHAHTQEVQQMLYAMRAPVPATAADLKAPSKWRQQPAPFVIDVGANVGWFTLNAAAAGGTVAAFEGGLVVRQGCELGGCAALPLCCSHYCQPVTFNPTNQATNLLPTLSPHPPAMSSNIRLLRTSLCTNPWLMKRVALYGTGLGTK